MERGGSDFEGEADQGHDDGQIKDRFGSPRAGLNARPDGIQVKTAADSIDQADAKKSKGGGDSTEKEVFQCGFGRCGTGLFKGGQRVEGNADQFERDKYDKKIAGTD